MRALLLLFLAAALPAAAADYVMQEFKVPAGSHPHDVAPAPDGTVWYTAQHSGALGRLDPATGRAHNIALGSGSSPHGVIVGPDGAAWVTDSGLNAIVRVDPVSEKVTRFPLPAGTPYANLNTAAFDSRGKLWFTGQSGYYGSVDPATGRVEVFQAPRGRGPYGIDATPDGTVYYVSLAGSHLARIDSATGRATVLEPPTPRQGARRVWSDSRGVLWITGWLSGDLISYDPRTGTWREIDLPATGGEKALPYAVYVDERDKVWVSDFRSNALLMYDPQTDNVRSFAMPRANASVRQMLGRSGEMWAAASGTDSLVVIRY